MRIYISMFGDFMNEETNNYNGLYIILNKGDIGYSCYHAEPEIIGEPEIEVKLEIDIKKRKYWL